MKEFDYLKLNNLVITPKMNAQLNHLYELRGYVANYHPHMKETFDRLVAVAKIQSTDASNRIEGIAITAPRLRAIMADKTRPANRSEAEIAGYRDVLALIHENAEFIEINAANILTLHKRLLGYTGAEWRGHFKDSDNQIITTYPDGTREVRFTPPQAVVTPQLITQLCATYNEALTQTDFSPLILTAAFIFDFVSIHPFRDGNGRMSRLLMLLALYRTHFTVGKYISLEKLLAETKDEYYAALYQSSQQWHENQNDYAPFVSYFLGILIQAYQQLIDRVGNSHQDKLPVTQLVLQVMHQQLNPLTLREIDNLIPQYSTVTIRRAVHQLLTAGKLRMVGRGRATRYMVGSSDDNFSN